jgi:glycosyltransferase involved in cell wall biosynthesis
MIRALAGSPADIYHIQFEYRGFGGFGRSLFQLVALCFLLGLRRPVVITLHGILTQASLEGRHYKHFAIISYFMCIRLSAMLCHEIIVPSELMRATLKQVYGITNTTVIPLGTDSPFQINSGNSSASFIVFYGFVRPQKGLDLLIEAMVQIRRVRPELKLMIVGGLARQEEAPYLNHLGMKVERYGLASNVEFINRSLSEVEKRRLLSETVALVLPYTDSFLECSAVVHDFAGYGVPLICSDAPRFSELRDGFDCLKVKASPDLLARSILTLLEDGQFAHRLAENLRQRATAESWAVVARLHQDLYKRIRNLRRGDRALQSEDTRPGKTTLLSLILDWSNIVKKEPQGECEEFHPSHDALRK